MQEGLRTAVTVEPLSAVGGLQQWQRLQTLAEEIFGVGDRPAQWFRRKLRREVVDDDLSWVAVTDQGRFCGYVLLGMPASLPGVARTAGVGVVPDLRGRGVGRRLMNEATKAARSRGARSLWTVASESARPFYHRLGFVPLRCLTTMHHLGKARRERALPRALPWQPAFLADLGPNAEVCGWLAEAWEGTEIELRRSLVVATAAGPSLVHLAREGTAWLVHRLVCPPDPGVLETVLQQVRDHFESGTPLLIASVEPPVCQRLLGHGWTRAQVGYEMELPLGSAP